jgi:hypothetical protein
MIEVQSGTPTSQARTTGTELDAAPERDAGNA